jgi:phosphatidylserine/phosphatidylglycerophosphate/cardiolipin synthase-like enzyme
MGYYARHESDRNPLDASVSHDLLFGVELYDRVVREAILRAGRRVWIATANLKDMHVPAGRGFVPILKAFEEMAAEGVQFRIIHSDLPSRPFRNTLEGLPKLLEGALELQVCPRSHWKMALVDGSFAYLGSANFTGAGLGARKPARRNLELGVTTDSEDWIHRLEHLFDTFWMGDFCTDCAFRSRCPDPIA